MKDYKITNSNFDLVNENECLRFVLVGISPGTNQTKDIENSVPSLEYKFSNAFIGKQMRDNLDNMFKHNPRLSELANHYKDIDDLFVYDENSIIDFTSLIKNKATEDNVLFNKPSQIKPSNPVLYEAFENGFKKDYENIYSKRNVLFIACGKQVYKFLKKHFPEADITAIVHPSPAAIGHIKKYLRDDYDPEKL